MRFEPASKHAPRFAGLLLASSLLIPFGVGSTALALELSCPGNACCMNDFYPGANCTANDLTFVLVGLGFQTDGCFGETDTLDIRLRAIVENTTAQTRYDVGIWIATDTDPNGDGAFTGTCAREVLSPVSSVQGSLACADLDLTCSTGPGPYYNADGDGCADLVTQGSAPDCGQVDDPTSPTDGPCTTADGIPDPSVLDFTVPVTVYCTDPDLDGFVNMDVCLSYGNQNNQVDTTGDGQCNSAAEVGPGTNAKCQCEDDFTSNIPMPDLALSCSCTGPVGPGFTSTCTVRYTNTDLVNCTPDTSKPAEFRCGSAAFFRFETDYDQANGSVGNFGVGSGAVTDDGDILTWNPDSSVAAAMTPDNVILEGQAATLTFDYVTSASAPDGTITNTVTAVWGESSAFPTPAAQSLAAACSVVVSSTWASVVDVELMEIDDDLVLGWRTAAEVRSLGFRVERQDPELGRFVPIGGLRAASQHGPGAEYRLRHARPRSQGDDSAGGVYRIVEVDVRGGQQVHGPYALQAEPANLDPAEVGFIDGDLAEIEPGTDDDIDFLVRPRSDHDRPAAGITARERIELAEKVAAPGRVALDIAFDQPGPHRLDVDTLAAALGTPTHPVETRPLEARLARGGLRLEHRGRPVPTFYDPELGALLLWVEPEIGAFEPHDSLRLLPGPATRLATLDTEPGLGAGPEHLPARRTFEEDLLPRSYLANEPTEDFWYWHLLSTAVPGYEEAILDLSPEAPAPGEVASFEIRLRGFTPGEHRARLSVDGAVVGEVLWDGETWHRERFALGAIDWDAPLGTAGRAELKIEALGGNFFVDGLELDYRRLPRAVDGRIDFVAETDGPIEIHGFDTPGIVVLRLEEGRATARLLPEIIAGGGGCDGEGCTVRFATEAGQRYAVVGDGGWIEPLALRRVDTALAPRGSQWPQVLHADHLVIAASPLVDSARALAAAHESLGRSSWVVDSAEIDAAFNHGIPSPLSIHRFLQSALEKGAHFRHVLLVGQGTWDHRDRLGLSDNLLPPLLVATAYGLQPSDGALLWPEPFDPSVEAILAIRHLPSIGRLPAATPGEVESYALALLAHATGREAGQAGADELGAPPLVVSDNRDEGGDFPTDGAALATLLGADHLSLEGQTVSQLRQALLPAFGEAPFVTYLGHGGLDRLAAEGLITLADVPTLALGSPTPLLALTCNIGYFAFPGFRSLGEQLLLAPDSGSPLVLSPSGLSAHPESLRLGREILLAALEGAQGKTTTFGEAIQEGARRYLEAGGAPQIVAIYNLLGDPALPLVGPDPLSASGASP